MKHRFQKTAKRWLAMLLCVGMLCQPGLFSAFAQEGPASPAPGTVQSGASSATPGEAPAAAPAAAAAPRAGTEHPLTETARHFNLSESRAKKVEALALDNVWLELPWWY